MSSENPFSSPPIVQQSETVIRPTWAVKHVPIVSGLMIAQGILTLIMGGLLFFLAFFMPVAVAEGGGGNEEFTNMMTMVAIGYGVFGFVVIVAALLNIVAGSLGFRFRGRMLSIVALFAGLIPMLTVYCAPTAIGLAVYGLIVLWNSEVAAAYDMRRQGADVREIRKAFS